MLKIFCNNNFIAFTELTLSDFELKYALDPVVKHIETGVYAAENRAICDEFFKAYFTRPKNFIMCCGSETQVRHAIQQFASHYHYLEAAGGLVFNPEGQVLLIERLGYVDLPKGKIDPSDEDQADAALREVREETGARCMLLDQPLPQTFHLYQQQSIVFLKCTYWFAMKALNPKEVSPQLEEDITRVFWVNPQDMAKFIPQTYPSLIPLFEFAANGFEEHSLI